MPTEHGPRAGAAVSAGYHGRKIDAGPAIAQCVCVCVGGGLSSSEQKQNFSCDKHCKGGARCAVRIITGSESVRVRAGLGGARAAFLTENEPRSEA